MPAVIFQVISQATGDQKFSTFFIFADISGSLSKDFYVYFCCIAGFVVEPAFSPATINQTSFAITNQWVVDGSVYAQPLYAPKV